MVNVTNLIRLGLGVRASLEVVSVGSRLRWRGVT